MKIVFFGNAATNNAAIRYRVIKFADMLESDGHTCVVCLPSSFHRWERLSDKGNGLSKLLYLLLTTCTRILQLRHVLNADAIIFRGPLVVNGYGPPILERIVRLLNRNMIYDIDDAIWEQPVGVDSPFLKLIDYNWVWKMCRMSTHGIVGNKYLKEHVTPHNPNVTIIPTCIDTDLHTQKEYKEDPEAPIVLGWTGLYTNLVYLDEIADVIQALAKEHNIVLSIATTRPYQLEGVTVQHHHWVHEHEIDYLKEADIGLMPLQDTPRARGKCAFKALEYMGVGTPCVVSPIGMNADIIEQGVTGFLANSPEEWREHLGQLISDHTLRRDMGLRARQVIVERYSHNANYPKMKALLQTIANPPRQTGP